MPFSKAGLAVAVMLTMVSGASVAVAADTPTVSQALATQIESDLMTLAMNNGGMPTDAQIQLQIATDLAMSNASLADKEAALQQVQTAALASGSGLPAGTGTDAGTAYADLTTTGSFVPAAGGGATGSTTFGSTGTSQGVGGGSSYQ